MTNFGEVKEICRGGDVDAAIGKGLARGLPLEKIGKDILGGGNSMCKGKMARK